MLSFVLREIREFGWPLLAAAWVEALVALVLWNAASPAYALLPTVLGGVAVGLLSGLIVADWARH